jgi:hypothetical protein
VAIDTGVRNVFGAAFSTTADSQRHVHGEARGQHGRGLAIAPRYQRYGGRPGLALAQSAGGGDFTISTAQFRFLTGATQRESTRRKRVDWLMAHRESVRDSQWLHDQARTRALRARDFAAAAQDLVRARIDLAPVYGSRHCRRDRYTARVMQQAVLYGLVRRVVPLPYREFIGSVRVQGPLNRPDVTVRPQHPAYSTLRLTLASLRRFCWAMPSSAAPCAAALQALLAPSSARCARMR